MNHDWGRYVRAVSHKTARVAVDATLRASLSHLNAKSQHDSGKASPEKRISVTSDSLRYKLFARKRGNLFIFAIDTSGSMALHRIKHAKAAVLQLLMKSYIDRDLVTIVAFKGQEATVCLPPSRSVLRARRVLDTLSVGGGTPLSAALECSLKIAKQSPQQTSLNTVLLLFTDGRANVPLRGNGTASRSEQNRLINNEIKFLGSELQHAGVRTIVIETQNPFIAGTGARDLAALLGAQLVQIESQLLAKSIS